VVADGVMHELEHEPPLAARLLRDRVSQQRCAGEVDPVVARIEPRRQLLHRRRPRRVEHDLGDGKRRVVPDHLCRCRQPFPAERRPEDVVPIHDPLHRRKVAIHERTVRKPTPLDQQVRVTLRLQLIVEQHCPLAAADSA